MAEPWLQLYDTPPCCVAEFMVRVEWVKVAEEPGSITDTTPPTLADEPVAEFLVRVELVKVAEPVFLRYTTPLETAVFSVRLQLMKVTDESLTVTYATPPLPCVAEFLVRLQLLKVAELLV